MLLDEVEQVRADLFGPEASGEVLKCRAQPATQLTYCRIVQGQIAEDHVLGHTAAKRCHEKLLSWKAGQEEK